MAHCYEYLFVLILTTKQNKNRSQTTLRTGEVDGWGLAALAALPEDLGSTPQHAGGTSGLSTLVPGNQYLLLVSLAIEHSLGA